MHHPKQDASAMHRSMCLRDGTALFFKLASPKFSSVSQHINHVGHKWLVGWLYCHRDKVKPEAVKRHCDSSSAEKSSKRTLLLHYFGNYRIL